VRAKPGVRDPFRHLPIVTSSGAPVHGPIDQQKPRPSAATIEGMTARWSNPRPLPVPPTGSEKAAAHRLGLSHSTVKHHLANARSKVGATTTAQLVWILREAAAATPRSRADAWLAMSRHDGKTFLLDRSVRPPAHRFEHDKGESAPLATWQLRSQGPGEPGDVCELKLDMHFGRLHDEKEEYRRAAGRCG
jgi:hypothetical protein